MTDSRQPSRSDQPRQGFDQTQPQQNFHQPRTDPAYSGQAPYTTRYGSGIPARPDPIESTPTDRLPQYWLQSQSPPGWQQGHLTQDEPSADGSSGPGRSKPPRWLWMLAGTAVLLVVALVIALVIANGTAKKGTTVPPLPTMPGSKSPSSSNAAPSSSAAPTATSPAPNTTPQTTSAVAAETVVYNITGEGRAISISYLDDEGIRQIEFNVALPWSKQVSVPKSANQRASITIVNIGHDVTCSVTVDGIPGRQRTGVGLTICEQAS